MSGALVAGALAAGLFAWRQAPGTRPEPDAAALAAPAVRASPPLKPAQIHAGPPRMEEPPLKVQVERLLATHRPEDAYRAYWLVADCAAFNLSGDRIVFDEEEIGQHTPGALPGFRGMNAEEKRRDATFCAGMTERERQSRLDYLAVAAKAGVFGAAVNFANEGPFGDPSALQTRPDDPLVREWKATASAQLTQAAEAGADISAIQYLMEEYGKGAGITGKNPLLAYRYLAAWTLIEEELLGPGNPASTIFASQREHALDTVLDVSPEQRATALAAAKRIADLARAKREAVRNAAPRG
jgi:hypothetical protein